MVEIYKVWLVGQCDILVTHALTSYQQCVGTKQKHHNKMNFKSFPTLNLVRCVKEDAVLCRYMYLLTVFSVAAAQLCVQPSTDHSMAVQICAATVAYKYTHFI